MGKIRSFLKRLFGKKSKFSITEEDRKKLRKALDEIEPFSAEELEKLEQDRASSENISLDDICEGQRDAFIAFVERGEDINNFVAHLDECGKCVAAIGKMFEKTEKAFERFVRDLRKQH